MCLLNGFPIPGFFMVRTTLHYNCVSQQTSIPMVGGGTSPALAVQASEKPDALFIPSCNNRHIVIHSYHTTFLFDRISYVDLSLFSGARPMSYKRENNQGNDDRLQ